MKLIELNTDVSNTAIVQKIFSVPRVLGSFPFDGRFIFSNKLFTYSLLVRMVSVVGILCSFRDEPFYIDDKYSSNATQKAICCAWAVANVINCVVPTFWCLFKRRMFSQLIKLIDEILITCPNIKHRNHRLNQTSRFLVSYFLYVVISIFLINSRSI